MASPLRCVCIYISNIYHTQICHEAHDSYKYTHTIKLFTGVIR